MSMKALSFSRPKVSYFLSAAGRSSKTYCCLCIIFLGSLAPTAKIPVPITLFPEGAILLPFIDSQSGKPVAISNKMHPIDHISYDEAVHLS